MTDRPLPITEELPISLRAYAQMAAKKGKGSKPTKRRTASLSASHWTLTFDTETTTNAGQALRFGTYQLRKDGKLIEAGIFFDPEGVTEDELDVLSGYAIANGLVLRTREEFVDEVFFGRAYQVGARIIGFNLPFDISRLAISHGSARAPKDDLANAMSGGFTFKLSRQKIYPNVRIRHMSRKAALISFAAPMGQRDSRGQRNRGIKRGIRRGHFLDVKTLSAALFARSFSLANLSAFLKVPNPKLEFDEFDGPITEEMVRYAVGDVQTTWECYAELIRRFNDLHLTQSVPEKVYSEAGIGKAYICEMGIEPWREVQSDFSPQMLANIMATYFGGRSEVRIRREIRQVVLCDFLSMYPTVCTLMNLWRFVIAGKMRWKDTTEATREFLDKVDLKKLRSRRIWRSLTTLVRVIPDADIFPVRANYSGEGQSTIGANYLTSETPLWFTLADCIAAKLLTGKTPRIIEAISFSSGRIQPGLKAIDFNGNSEYRIDPNSMDFFKRIIELRQSVKERMKAANPEERERLDTEQHALKICANSTSYGIWVEVNVETRRKLLPATVHNSTGDPFDFLTDKAETPGRYFHPLLATLITGAARLMLATAERLAIDHGLDWAFCDTDSMAFAMPAEMPEAEFQTRVKAIVGWFAPLNPYDFDGSILKIEDVNSSLENNQPLPLYCFAVSSKRYALFNLGLNGVPVMRKVSAHGLGHLLPPYDENDAPAGFPIPHKSVLKDGTVRWHCDLWHQIVSAALADHPDEVRRDYHPAMARPALSRYSATSPDLLRWFKTYNRERNCRYQVKPFGFMLSMTPAWDARAVSLDARPARGRQRKAVAIRPIAPFETDHRKAVGMAFDRETGAPISQEKLRTYADALERYHISPEAKFLNGDYAHHGTTERRHIRVSSILHIGKETHDWERQAIIGMNEDSQIAYGASSIGLPEKLRSFIAEQGMAQTAKALKISQKRLVALVSGEQPPGLSKFVQAVARRLPEARSLCDRLQKGQSDEITRLREAVARDGLRATARRIGIDPSNLRRHLRSFK
jgi:hypothetical protein